VAVATMRREPSAGATLAIASALAVAVWHKAVLTKMELALYWLGSAIGEVLAMGALFHGMRWSWFGVAETFAGFLPGAIFAAISGLILLVIWRWRSATRS
jgi:hypothetical protein